jgi:hypothetical protein
MFKQVNFDELNYYLIEADLCKVIQNEFNVGNNIDHAWSKWKSTVTDIIDKIVPKVKLKGNSKCPWIDGEVIHASHIKNSARKRALRTNSMMHWNHYKILCKTTKKTCQS